MSKPRPDFSGHVVHAMNRRVDRQTLFLSDEDYEFFRSLLGEAVHKFDMRILEWVIMPNHWHMLVWPEEKEQLSDFMQWLLGVHAKLWRESNDTPGLGAVYQSRYKAFPVKPGFHVNQLRNYLAMNPVKANLVRSPFDWMWGSAKRANYESMISTIPLSNGPGSYPENLKELLSTPQDLTEYQIQQLNDSLKKGIPLGDDQWISNMIKNHYDEDPTQGPGHPKII